MEAVLPDARTPPQESTPQVSVIVVNHNGRHLLGPCLDSLSRATYPNLEIIVVDNGSEDGSVDFVGERYPWVRIEKLGENLGFAHPSNMGAQKAGGDLLLFLNNDTTVEPDSVSALVRHMESDPAVAICQSLLLRPGGGVDSAGDFVDLLGRAYSSRTVPSAPANILSARGASALVRRDVFEMLGGFDEKFFASYEDVDLGWRAWISGFGVSVVPSSVVHHTSGQTIGRLPPERTSFHSVKNSLILRLTNFEPMYAARSVLVLLPVLLARKISGRSVIDDPEPAPLAGMGVYARAALWILGNLGYVLSRRSRINRMRKRSTGDLLRTGVITR